MQVPVRVIPAETRAEEEMTSNVSCPVCVFGKLHKATVVCNTCGSRICPKCGKVSKLGNTIPADNERRFALACTCEESRDGN